MGGAAGYKLVLLSNQSGRRVLSSCGVSFRGQTNVIRTVVLAMVALPDGEAIGPG